MAKPDLIKWVSSDDPLAISDPGASKKIAGFLYKEKPPFQYLNWIFNQAYKWFLGLSGNYYDVVVGSAAEVTALEATNVLGDLDNTLVTAGTKVLIKDGTHTLLANLALSGADVVIDAESPESIIAVSTFQILLTGARQKMKMRVTGAGANDIQLSGAGAIFEGIDVANTAIQLTNGAIAISSGASGLIHNINGVFSSTLTLLGTSVMNLGTAQSFTAQKNFLSVALTWGANVSWNLNTQQVSKLTLTGATAELDNPTNMIDGGTYAIKVIQDATGSRILTFGTAYKWPNGVVPDLSALGANEYMRINFESDGSVMDGVAIGPFS